MRTLDYLTLTVNGISGDVDLDTAYVDYPAKMKSAGLNGYSKQNTASVPDVPAADDKTNDNAVSVSVQIGNNVYKGTLTKD